MTFDNERSPRSLVLGLGLLVSLLLSSPASAADKLPPLKHKTSVAKAYKMIPHRRTQFDFKNCQLKGDEKAYLKSAFAMIDEVVRCRVITLHEYVKKAPKKASKSRQHLESLQTYWGAVTAPKSLQKYHDLIASALSLQIEFFKEWEQAGKSYKYGNHKALRGHAKVKKASRSLIGAYKILMSKYRSESKLNRQAFFDYHCAFDFI